jgi:glycosyltransferase involved in cell wall biosynthesis
MRKIRNVVNDVEPDFVISFISAMNALVLLSMIGLSIPVIASEHYTFKKKHSSGEWFRRFFINRMAYKVTVLTKSDKEIIGSKLKNIVVMPNPLSFKLKNDIDFIREKTVLAVGRIDRWYGKGFDTLIKIWSKIILTYPDWKLNIVGGGSNENIKILNDNFISEYDCGSSVTLLGFHKEIDRLMQRSAIFVLASRYEGLPMALLEAMSQGCACVSFDCPSGPSEILENGQSGLLVKDQDEEAMLKAIELLIQDKNLRERFSLNGQKAAKAFEADKIVDYWESLFLNSP